MTGGFWQPRTFGKADGSGPIHTHSSEADHCSLIVLAEIKVIKLERQFPKRQAYVNGGL